MSTPPHDDSCKGGEDFTHGDDFDHHRTHDLPPFQPPIVPAAAQQPPAAVNKVQPRQLAPPRKTDHSYFDYSTHSPSPCECPITKRSHDNFPAKLHRLISDPANAEAIQWQPHGRGALFARFCVSLLVLHHCIANSSAVCSFNSYLKHGRCLIKTYW
jgi:hypothetical protein